MSTGARQSIRNGIPASTLAASAGPIVAITVVLYHGWLMPFFQPFFAGREAFARVVFYALYGSLVLTAGAVMLGRHASPRRSSAPFVVVGIVAIAATALHPVGLVTRAYIIAMIVGGAAAVLMLVAPSRALLQMLAAVTILNATLCLVDLLFPVGFTNTVGRAAGLAINPNDAAASLLLGAAASYRAVPVRIRRAFLVLTAGSLISTLSRSTLLAAGAALALPAIISWWTRAQPQRRRWMDPAARRPAALASLGIVVSIAAAALTNPYFRTAVSATVADSVSFARALDDARRAVAGGSGDTSRAPDATHPDETVTAGDRHPSETEHIAALDARLRGEGRRNSMSARALLLDRALLVYRNNGVFGMGLEGAHLLAPHNTFVLFGLAFGYGGWLIPLALLGLTLYAARDARDVPLSVAAAGTMATSHDILVMPSLFLPIAIGIGGMLARGSAVDEHRPGARSLACASVAGVGLFAAGCVAIALLSPAVTIDRLPPGGMTERGGAYLAYFPPQVFPGLRVPARSASQAIPAFLRQDSRPLTRVTWTPGVIPELAPGEYAIGEYRVMFATLDGRDPRTADVDVELGLSQEVGRPFYALLATLAAWCAGVLLVFGRRGGPGASPPDSPPPPSIQA